MNQLKARNLLAYTTDQLWETLKGPFSLQFDDGEAVETNARETILSSYAWAFHRSYPNTPLLKHHHVRTILGPKRFGPDTTLQLLNNCMWSVYDTYEGAGTVTLDKLSEVTYRLTNVMYNDLTYRLESDITSLDITDYVQVLDIPEILAAKEGAPETIESVLRIHNVIKHHLLNDPRLERNPVSRAVRSGIASMSQVLQIVGPRGEVSDIDNNTFIKPIMRGFAEGLRTLYDSFIESRHASFALAQAKDPLEQTEYFSRRLQLICQTVQNLNKGDCGSTEYMYWTIRDQVIEDGRVTQKCDLDLLAGKYFLNSSGGLSCIGKGDRDLIGHTLKLRSVLHCASKDPYGVCSTCFGEMSLSIPEGSNLGQQCCTFMTAIISQNVLSTKHDAGSSTSEAAQLDNYSKHYLALTPDRMGYMLHERLRSLPTRLVIEAKRAANLNDILAVDDVNHLTSITRISKLEVLGIQVGEEPLQAHKVSVDRRYASMTYAFLAYIKQVGWENNEHGDYVVDMAGWNWAEAILTLPMMRHNQADHAAEIADKLEATVKDMEERDMTEKVDPMIGDLFDQVNTRLQVNLAILEVVVFGGMVVSATKGDYSLPKVGTDRGLGVYNLTIENRSMAAKFAYEHQLASIKDPHNFITWNRLDAPFDPLICPVETLQHLE